MGLRFDLRPTWKQHARKRTNSLKDRQIYCLNLIRRK